MQTKRFAFRPQVECLERRDVPAAPFLLPDFHVVAVGDFDGNGSADLAMQHNATNQGVIWFMEGTRRIEATWITTPGDPWSDIRIAAAGDFDRDGLADLVFEQNSTGEKGIWLMRGAQRREQIWIARPSDSPKFYAVAAAGDFDGNGSTDLALEYGPSGDKQIWSMSGTARADAYWVTRPIDSPANYRVVAAGDFNGDGKADLVMNYLLGGDKAIWLMDGANRLDASWIQRAAGTQTDYTVLGAADFSLDGRTDLILYHVPSADLQGWIMAGRQRAEAIWYGRHDIGASWSGNGIVLTAGSGDDFISIDKMGSGVQVYANGTYDFFRSEWLARITVNAGGGNDRVVNNSSRNSVLSGGEGHDSLFGGSGRDELYGNVGNDLLDGRSGGDYLNGDEGNDTVYGGTGDDLVAGSDGNDWLEGNDGADEVQGGRGSDTLVGGRGNDRYVFQEASIFTPETDRVVELPGEVVEGRDWMDFSVLAAGVTVDLSNFEVVATMFGRTVLGPGPSIERVQTGYGNDWLRGSNGTDELRGGAGNDVLIGLEGGDALWGGDGNDSLIGLGGNDALFGGDGNDMLFPGLGRDYIDAGRGADRYLQLFGDNDDYIGLSVNIGAYPDIGDNWYRDTPIVFQNGRVAWTTEEILLVDQAFAKIVDRTNSTKLLRWGARGNEFGKVQTFQRQSVAANPGTLADNNSQGLIRIYNSAFTSDQNVVPIASSVLHEIGHNWDDENPGWGNFLGLSGWTTANMSRNADFVAVAVGPTTWYRLRSAQFVTRNNDSSVYASSGPREDFAETFAAAFGGYTSKPLPTAKINFVNAFINTKRD